MKNLLTLHEAIVIALVNIDKTTFAASFDEVAAFIEKRNLFPERKGGVDLATQVMLRSTKAKGAYHYLFDQVNDTTIRLRANNTPVPQKAKSKPQFYNGFDMTEYMTSKPPIAKIKKGEEII